VSSPRYRPIPPHKHQIKDIVGVAEIGEILRAGGGGITGNTYIDGLLHVYGDNDENKFLVRNEDEDNVFQIDTVNEQVEITDFALRFNESVGGNYLDLALQLFEDMDYPGEYNPFIHVAQGFWCQKDVFSQGFLGSASRIYIEFGGTYTPAVASDIGKLVYANGTDPEDVVGALVGYWNSAEDYENVPSAASPSVPTWWIIGYYEIASGSAMTIPSGTGAGTTNAGWQTQPGGGAIQIGHGLSSTTDPPKIVLSSSELGFDKLYIHDLNGVLAGIAVKDVQIGDDVKLYREAADTLATDDNLEVHNQYLNLDKSTAPVQFTLQVDNVDKSRWLFDGTDVYLTAETGDLNLSVGGSEKVIVNGDLEVTGDITGFSVSRSDISDFWDTPFWNSIPDKPSTYPPSSHNHAASDITSGVFNYARIPWTSIPASGIQIGSGDIYWQTATQPDVLETNVPWIFDSSVQIGDGLSVTGSLGLTGNITLGTTITFTDINLYRQTTPSVCLELDDDMIIDGALQVGAGLSVTGALGVTGTIEGGRLKLPYVGSDPGSPANGEIWVRSNL